MTSPVSRIRANHLMRKLRLMNLNPDEFVVFGSAPLLAHGLRQAVRDLDIVARAETWRHVAAIGKPATGTYSRDRVWQFFDGSIQFSAGWITDDWNADELIDEAEIIDGIRFANLSDVLRYKEQLHRSKDRSDIASIHRYLSTRETNQFLQ